MFRKLPLLRMFDRLIADVRYSATYDAHEDSPPSNRRPSWSPNFPDFKVNPYYTISQLPRSRKLRGMAYLVLEDVVVGSGDDVDAAFPGKDEERSVDGADSGRNVNAVCMRCMGKNDLRADAEEENCGLGGCHLAVR